LQKFLTAKRAKNGREDRKAKRVKELVWLVIFFAAFARCYLRSSRLVALGTAA
jgi:hypothetical protein